MEPSASPSPSRDATAPNVLAIAGLDPSGGAGILADVKTVSALGCYGLAVATALTAQNTTGVRAVHTPPAEFVAAQVDAVCRDVEIHAVKVGMAATAAIAEALAERLRFYAPAFVVIDPVLAASSGDALATGGTMEALRSRLLPLATLVTPNLDEAALLAGFEGALAADEDIVRVGRRLLQLGAKAVLIKGGHRAGAEARDFLVTPEAVRVHAAPFVSTQNTHGTGCTLSAAIAAELALGLPLQQAVAVAKAYLTEALRASKDLKVGRGHGPLHHFWNMGKAPLTPPYEGRD